MRQHDRVQTLTALYFTGPLYLTANNLKKTPFMTYLQQMTGTVCDPGQEMEAHNTEQLIAHSEDSCEAAGSPVQVIDAHIRFLVNWYPFTVASSLIKAAGVCVTQLVCVCVTQLVCVCNTADVCVCVTQLMCVCVTQLVTVKRHQCSLDSSHHTTMLHTGRYLRCLFLQRTKRHPPITIATMIETATATTAMLAWLEVVGGGGVEWVPGASEAGSTTFLLGVRREGGGGGWKEGEGRREGGHTD